MSINALIALDRPQGAPIASVGEKQTTNVPLLPNLISFAGYAAGLGYLAGASPWFAVASIAADEADGRIARSLGQTSQFGSNADWGIDLALTALYMDRLGFRKALPFMTAAQVYARTQDVRPPILSVRALLMGYALYETRFGRLPPRP